jgi:uncharacterized membrane protein
MTRPRLPELFEPDRLLAFSDGVFGVAITLLVIDVRLPSVPTGSDDTALLQALVEMGLKLFVFAFTFLILGMSWLGHHRKFSYIRKVDGRLLWMNLLYLMTLCLVPFASSVLAEHGGSRIAFILYAGVMTMADLLSAGLSAYGLREPFLGGRSELSRGFRRDMVLSPLCAGLLFLIGAALALGGWVRLAHWTLLIIVPVMAFWGSHVRGPLSVEKS